ncbi:MAG TPA: M28 family peptidase [Candidatus Thermoplasmatota archaeon]|nr:M28 family peptidase [Candidatus Thermoplasmatota archaeon]
MKLLAILLVALLAGCASTSPPPAAAPAPATLLERTAASVPALPLDAKAAVDWWSSFAQTYTARSAFTANNAAARDHIAAGLAEAGLQVRLLQYPVGAEGLALPATAGPLFVNVVEATKPGDGEGTIALGTHYDGSAAATVQAAYDNGSGTAALYSLCTALAKVPTRHSFTCLFFDGEELGALGSQAYVADPTRPVPDYYLGFDMVGLNWPGIDTTQVGKEAWKLYAWTGPEFADALFPFVNGTLHGVLGYPASGAQAFPFNDRNSDEASFAQAHVPTVRFAGGRTAGSYPQYHLPGDTVEYVEQFAGGRDRFEAGLAAVVRTAWQVALQLDQASLDDLRAR